MRLIFNILTWFCFLVIEAANVCFRMGTEIYFILTYYQQLSHYSFHFCNFFIVLFFRAKFTFLILKVFYCVDFLSSFFLKNCCSITVVSFFPCSLPCPAYPWSHSQSTPYCLCPHVLYTCSLTRPFPFVIVWRNALMTWNFLSFFWPWVTIWFALLSFNFMTHHISIVSKTKLQSGGTFFYTGIVSRINARELCLNECVWIGMLNRLGTASHINSLLMCNQSLELLWTWSLMNRWRKRMNPNPKWIWQLIRLFHWLLIHFIWQFNLSHSYNFYPLGFQVEINSKTCPIPCGWGDLFKLCDNI